MVPNLFTKSLRVSLPIPKLGFYKENQGVHDLTPNGAMDKYSKSSNSRSQVTLGILHE
jgi:hypothetical protein